MKFVSLASGSSGNAALISYKNTNILVDCGISRKKIVEHLSEIGLALENIDAILITHEHEDHTLGLPSILKKNKIKLLSQRETLLKINDLCEKKGTKIDTDCFKIIHPLNTNDPGTIVNIKDIKVYPIKGAHDVPSVFYKIILGDTSIAIVTDIGIYNDFIYRSISDVSYLMLECNYDIDMMLSTSVYPPCLKQRIMSDRGHLSNVQCSEFIMKLANSNLKKVFLSHISKVSNSEEYAYEFVTKYLKKNYKGEAKLPDIGVAKRSEKTIIIEK